jgi:hypothetical protein
MEILNARGAAEHLMTGRWRPTDSPFLSGHREDGAVIEQGAG